MSHPRLAVRALILSAVALAATIAAASPAHAASPRYILVTGPHLAHSVTLGSWEDNQKLYDALLSAARPAAGWQRNRERYDLALFWGVPAKPVPTDPAKASQHGAFYPATQGRRAVIELLIDGQDFPRVVPPRALSILARHGVPTQMNNSTSLNTFDKNGVGATLPPGWWASDRRMSSGIEPVFRLTVANRPLVRTAKDEGPCYGGVGKQIQPEAVVAILREAVGSDFKPARFSKRPERFVLPRRRPGQDNSCLGDHATLITFKDAGRGFYLWIAAGRDAPAARVKQLLTILNALTISRP